MTIQQNDFTEDGGTLLTLVDSDGDVLRFRCEDHGTWFFLQGLDGQSVCVLIESQEEGEALLYALNSIYKVF